eukprot:1847987-Karenia_brevis.AAC.1
MDVTLGWSRAYLGPSHSQVQSALALSDIIYGCDSRLGPGPSLLVVPKINLGFVHSDLIMEVTSGWSLGLSVSLAQSSPSAI